MTFIINGWEIEKKRKRNSYLHMLLKTNWQCLRHFDHFYSSIVTKTNKKHFESIILRQKHSNFSQKIFFLNRNVDLYGFSNDDFFLQWPSPNGCQHLMVLSDTSNYVHVFFYFSLYFFWKWMKIDFTFNANWILELFHIQFRQSYAIYCVIQ